MAKKELEAIADEKIIGFAQYHPQVHRVSKIDKGWKIIYFFQIIKSSYDFDLGDHLCRQEINVHRRTGLNVELLQCSKDFLDKKTPTIYTKAS